jgi:hypothetical protein
MPLKFLLPIIGEEAEWYSLQKDVREGSPLLDSTPSIIDYAEAFGDLNDTAALIAELDLVITIDCVITTGSLGKPVWILLAFHSDFRYLRNREDNPWSPRARLFPQRSEGD